MANHPNRVGYVDKAATTVTVDEYYISQDTDDMRPDWAPGYTRMFMFTPERAGQGLASMTDRHFTSVAAAREFAARKYPNARQVIVGRRNPAHGQP